ncbi:MAG: universal stress protein [Gemmataceae bacterium]|nr:universal stress protein [Gemmata sp.]MDW8199479.1 universal stress protein [Gemmataceae bacterium]
MRSAAITRPTQRFRRLSLRLRVVKVPALRGVRVRSPRRGRGARVVIFSFLVAVVLLHGAVVLMMDVVWPRLRDPEYGLRVAALQQRLREYPQRPLVLAIGNSRTAMGIRPEAWEAVRPGTPNDPLLFNMAIVGSGPILELLTLRRVYADGFRPDLVLLEYWPPFLRQDGEFGEAARFDPRRLRWSDRATIRSYYPNAAAVERRMWLTRLNAISDNRQSLLIQTDDDWFPRPWRINGNWVDLDPWGWLPGMDPAPQDVATRRRLIEHQRPFAIDRFQGHTIHPESDRAIREAVALVRAQGAEVALVYLPESAEYQSWYPPDVEHAACAHLATLCRELGVPVINTRDWMDECYLADGFHLSRIGATLFTARLGPVMAELLGPSGKRP